MGKSKKIRNGNNNKNSNEDDDLIMRIFPTAEELSSIKTSVPCTEDECNEVFPNVSSLNLHLYKSHKRDIIQFDPSRNTVSRQFHCPDIDCVYHDNMSFKSMRLLKQHYLKVHSPKSYICEKCNKGFSTAAFKNTHYDYCGIMFKCTDCPATYITYESLLTHARRKKHKIQEKVYFKPDRTPLKTTLKLPDTVRQPPPLIPKPVQVIETCDKNIQTDEIKSKVNRLSKNSMKIRKERQTQTSSKKAVLSIETQTSGSYSRNKISFKKNQNYTQTSRNKSTKRTDANSSPFRENSDSLPTKTHLNFDANFFNCNMETQTDLKFNEDLFQYCDFYNNTHTQTCEENTIFEPLQLNDIETQTVDEMWTTVGSQTISQMSSNDINHVETQTDSEFRELFNAINY